MMGFIFCFVAIGLLQWLTPYWWWIMVVPFIWTLMQGKSFRGSFLVGALSAGLLWLIAASWQWSRSAHIVADRVADMLTVGSSMTLIFLTFVFAFLAAGFAGGSGYLLQRALFPGKPSGE